MPPKRSKPFEKGRHSSRPAAKARPTPQRADPDVDMDLRGVGAGTVPTDGTGIPPRVVSSAPTRTAPVTNNEMLEHLGCSERITFGKVMQAIMNYWYEPKFEEQLSRLCSDKIWIDRLVAQPMDNCAIAFCERCKIILRSDMTDDSYFSVHADIICTLQKLYEDLQSTIVENGNSEKVNYPKRYRRLRGFTADGSIVHEDRPDTGFESDSDGQVIEEDSIIVQQLQSLTVTDEDDIVDWSKLDKSSDSIHMTDDNEISKNRCATWAMIRHNAERNEIGRALHARLHPDPGAPRPSGGDDVPTDVGSPLGAEATPEDAQRTAFVEARPE